MNNGKVFQMDFGKVYGLLLDKAARKGRNLIQLCRKSKCPRPPGTLLPLSCSLEEAGGRGGRATAKPTGSGGSSADGFAVRMERTKMGAGL